jgi:sugar (pentulose or hexulose) kinase
VLGTTAIHAVLGLAADGESSGGVFGVPYPEAGLQLRGAAPAAATTNLDWVARTCWPGRDDGVADALRGAARVPAGSGGLIFHPYLSPGGERGPFVSAAARAQFFGLTAAHDRSHLARAVLEGVAFAGRESYLALGGVPGELVISGGGADSELWCRIFADVVGTRVVVAETADSGCRGAAAIAARGVEGSPRPAETMTARTPWRVHEPDPAAEASYQQLFQIFVDLRHASAPRWDALARLVHPL